jgi:microcystin-dependent protein
MSEQFLGEVRIFGFNFAPRGWALCNGQMLGISQNQPLFALLGTTFGGDGRTTFALPDLRGRVPLHADGSQFTLGSRAGEATHATTIPELPVHPHAIVADDSPAAADGQKPEANRRLSQSSGTNVYGAYAAATPMAVDAIGMTGGGTGHENMQPFLALVVCIALTGIFPSRD